MFDAGKLLGGLVGNSLGNSTMGLGGKAAIGMGLLGVAMAAFEHYSEQSKARQGVPPQGGMNSWNSGDYAPPAPGAGAPPPPPPGMAGAPTGGPATPPPPPPGEATPAPQPETQVDSLTAPQPDPQAEARAVLLIRTMIAAAHADGVLDAQERGAILGKLESAGLSDEERAFLSREFLAPASVDDLAAEVKTPEQALEVYAASLLAIEVDTDAERDWLRSLAAKLGLTPAEVAQAHEALGRGAQPS